MDNREFLVKQDEIHREYFAKLSALAEAHQANLDPQFRDAMRLVVADASASIQAFTNQTATFQEQVVNRAQKILEQIDDQAKRLAASSNQVLQTAQTSAQAAAHVEAQVTDRLGRLVSVAEGEVKRMQTAIQVESQAIDQVLNVKAREVQTAVAELNTEVSNAAYEAARTLTQGVGVWATMIRWVITPAFVAACLAAVAGAGWAGKTYGEQSGFAQARDIAREQVRADLVTGAVAYQPIFDPGSGRVSSIKPIHLSKPIIVVDGQPRWMSRSEQGWEFGGRVLNHAITAEVWDRKDKAFRILASDEP